MEEDRAALLRGPKARAISEFLFVAMLHIKGKEEGNEMRFDEFAIHLKRWLEVVHRKNKDFIFRIGNGRGLKGTLKSLAAQNLVEISYDSLEPADREFPLYQLTPCGKGHFKLYSQNMEEYLNVSFGNGKLNS